MDTDNPDLMKSLFDDSLQDGRERVDQITEAIIGCAFKVGGNLGCGFLEKVYENALCHELRKSGFSVRQ